MKDFQGSLVDAEVAIKYNDKWGKVSLKHKVDTPMLKRVLGLF